MVKDVLAIVEDARSGAAFLSAAAGFAQARGAFLKVAALTPSPMVAARIAPFGSLYVPEDVLMGDDAANVAKVRDALASTDCRHDVIGFHDDVAWLTGTLRKRRQLADLILVGPEESWTTPWLRRRVVETLIKSAGTPLLILPRPLALIERAVIGWKPSPEANRALHDLVGIVEDGATIDVVTVGLTLSDCERDDTAHAEIVRHLSCHGLKAESRWIVNEERIEADVLTSYAIDVAADVLAIGGFAHPRDRPGRRDGRSHRAVRPADSHRAVNDAPRPPNARDRRATGGAAPGANAIGASPDGCGRAIAARSAGDAGQPARPDDRVRGRRPCAAAVRHRSRPKRPTVRERPRAHVRRSGLETGIMKSDEQLQRDVIDELEWDPRVDHHHIGVAIEAGVVSLSGTVPTFVEKLAAERAVRRGAGVRAVAQEIKVHAAADPKTSDEEIARRICDLFAWDSILKSEHIDVRVENAWVTLTGTVDWQYPRDAATRAAGRIHGVRMVTNAMTLRRLPVSGDVRDRIMAAFRRHADIDARGITVTTDGDTVTLGGLVHAYREREIADRAAWAAPGVTAVDDHIIVA